MVHNVRCTFSSASVLHTSKVWCHLQGNSIESVGCKIKCVTVANLTTLNL